MPNLIEDVYRLAAHHAVQCSVGMVFMPTNRAGYGSIFWHLAGTYNAPTLLGLIPYDPRVIIIHVNARI